MSVRVVVRCRPFNQTEVAEGSEQALTMSDSTVAVDYAGSSHTFTYDDTLCSVEGTKDRATQETVYESVAAPLLGHVLTGYNGCIFAYGQTGSGKTYSMVGTESEKGIIPRITESLFDNLSNLQDSEMETCVEVSFFEIYNEKVRCLLCPTSEGFDSSLRVREHPTFGPFIEGLSKFVVTSKDECLRLLNDGNTVRSTASTAMNAVSSRSHAVFTITLTQSKTSGPVTTSTISKLNLVDLAGSERASRTLATGKRLAEGSTINKSLSCLGKVISTLAEAADQAKQRHIPYRDSTLTWILKDNLGGNSKTVMLATVSPAAIQLEETLSTLRYAERAKKIMNKAVVNESNNNEVIAALQKEIEQLNAALKDATQTDRAALMEEIMATEAMKREMDITVAEKLAETKRLMEDREGYMRDLESRLLAQNSEIEALRAANMEKEQRILQLLKAIESKGVDMNNDDFDTMRVRVAELEREQKNARATMEIRGTSEAPQRNRQAMDSVDSDLSLGSSLLSGTDHAPLSSLASGINLDDDEFDIDMDLDDLMAAREATAVAVQYADANNLLPRPVSEDQNNSSIHLSSDTSIVLDDDAWDEAVTEEEVKEAKPSVPVAECPPPPAVPMIYDYPDDVPLVRVDSDKLANNCYLDATFFARVTFGTLLYGRCGVECDLLRKQIRILTVHGKTIDHYDSVRIERVYPDSNTLTTLHFSVSEVQKEYTCEFDSVQDKSYVLQLLIVLRRNTLWCPALCGAYGADEVNIAVKGTTIQRDGAVVQIQGDTIIAVSKLPFDIFGFWCGCFSLEDGPLPKNPAVFNGFLPEERPDIYVIGIIKALPAISSGREVPNMLLEAIGKDGFMVVDTTAGKGAEDSLILTVICRKELCSRISQMKLFSAPQNNVFAGKGGVIVLNRSSLAILVVERLKNEVEVKQCNAALREMLSSGFCTGDTVADIAVRFDSFVVAGDFGYENAFCDKTDELKNHMKANNILSDFCESAPSPSLQSVSHPTRILTLAQPHISRLDIAEYGTSRALSSSSYITGDIFIQSHMLSVFSNTVRRLSAELSNLTFRSQRLASVVNGASLQFTGNALASSPVVVEVPHLLSKELTKQSIRLPLFVDALEMLHMLTLRCSIVGAVRDSPTPTTIASGIVSLRHASKRTGQPIGFKAVFYRATCNVGMLSGQIIISVD